MEKQYINENYSTDGFTSENTEGFSEVECGSMNIELFRRLKSDELIGMPDYEREKMISEEILNRF